MILTIIGWIWVVTGILFLIFPEMLRKRLTKKSVRKVRGLFFVMALTVGGLIMKASWGMEGILSTIVFVVGIIAVIKGFLFLNGKAAEKIVGVYVNAPVKYLRVWALAQIGFGVLMLMV